ncbi:BREX-1 system adenine-specific DNA-methyltransferase PglX [Oceanobacter sp. 5_MG-2023]|uniref:BREX-1 system adenine-specific DNA-methyltransferase PglX n=1 Tax=Oceanobacter sp. 5_MG-2023 TaxID=3062645 RepID=UPI0026E17E1C|nr:BREX-1 system adenine-specific DNA-methyltransferase PglX [Oceanobacter sp. 5_MG-2023]MDO6683773.1 BREX-1 system adenine-specific DNA-methyltransferase PglX [Oceanobacter sp. 5_MG-2023]
MRCPGYSTRTNLQVDGFVGSYVDLNKAPQSANKKQVFLTKNLSDIHQVDQRKFLEIPGATIVYWAPNRVFDIFSSFEQLHNWSELKSGISTGDNDRFYREWFEVNCQEIQLKFQVSSNKKWFPIVRGGDFRRWYGNRESVLNLKNNGQEIANSGNNYRLRDSSYYDKTGITWSRITSGTLSFRLKTKDVNFGENSPCLFSESDDFNLLAILNSRVSDYFLSLVSPTLSNQVTDVGKIPMIECGQSPSGNARSLVKLNKLDWNAYERSWDFQYPPILSALSESNTTLESSYTVWNGQNRDTFDEVRRLEEENNRLFIDAYGLQDELTPEVPIEQITLTVNPAYRYGIKGTEEERNARFREDTMAELVSYAIGCMMGRYSLDEPGLIYANSGNEGFDDLVERGAYTKFPADDDGIIPLTDKEWFADDAANRLVEFISVAWPAESLEENLDFLAANLSPKKGEDSRDTIRRYLCDKFYKDHMQTYKKRPIYWLFSSGKQKAFQCLVYLHRYNESTLARMRTEYVIPLTAKLSAHIDNLESDKLASDSAAEIKKLEKEINTLQKQQTELTEFDDKLKHFADMRIRLDLDDGVKVNYGKFGDLLAEVKAIHGKTSEHL